jgi:hypothetical protein
MTCSIRFDFKLKGWWFQIQVLHGTISVVLILDDCWATLTLWNLDGVTVQDSISMLSGQRSHLTSWRNRVWFDDVLNQVHRPISIHTDWKFGSLEGYVEAFRFRGDPIEPDLKWYLDALLENCNVMDKVEIPVEIGEVHGINMWMGWAPLV